MFADAAYSADTGSAERRQFFEQITLPDGQVAEITVVGFASEEKSAHAAIASAKQKMISLDQELGNFPDNTLAKINQLGRGKELELSPQVFTLIKKSIALSKSTSGWFDLASNSPKNSFTQRNYRRIQLNNDRQSISFKSNSMKLDVNWFLRAAIVDLAIDTLRENNFQNAKAELGGVSRHIGQDIFTPWSLTIGLKNENSQYAHRAFQYGLTSAATVVINKANAGEMTDAKNKKKIRPKVKSVSLISSNAVTATAYAIAAYSLDPLTGIRYVEKHPAVHGFIIDKKGGMLTSKGLAENIKKAYEKKDPEPDLETTEATDK